MIEWTLIDGTKMLSAVVTQEGESEAIIASRMIESGRMPADASYRITDGTSELVRQIVEASRAKMAAMVELAKIDAASIRSIREYIASKPDAPQILKDRESAAIEARGRIPR